MKKEIWNGQIKRPGQENERSGETEKELTRYKRDWEPEGMGNMSVVEDIIGR